MTLEELQSTFPLSKAWKNLEVFEEECELDGLSIQLMGLSVEHQEGLAVIGSAAHWKASEKAGIPTRAYFELLERTSIIEAMEQHPEYFPDNPEPEKWQYAKSNGVAAHTSWNEACQRAQFEVLERDAVLRSWYGARAPVVTPIENAMTLPGYSLKWVGFPSCYSGSIQVAGVFATPDSAEHPYVYGFAAHAEAALAFESAFNECVQRLGFLWGEPLEPNDPPFSPTADFHQEYFLRPAGVALIEEWLTESHHAFSEASIASKPLPSFKILDLTPEHLQGKMTVVKAITPECWELCFGDYAPYQQHTTSPHRRIHPIA